MGFYILTYLCIAVFILATGYVIYRQIRLPLHLRWEIYPVQHEPAAKSAYGGSYLEGLNWWEKKQENSLFNEMWYMVPEILLLQGLWHKNRRLWWVSFPFHFGMYLMVVTFGLLVLHAFFVLGGFSSGTIAGPLSGLIVVTGWIGLILGIIGSLGVLYKRITDRQLRYYSSFIDYFNVIFIFLFFFFAFMCCLWGDPFLEGAKTYILALLTGGASPGSHAPNQNIFGILTIVSASLLIAYIPLTHMSHMFMKYFLYHNVKWDDAPNRRGGRMEAAIKNNLEFKPTWQAKHIGADGLKSWSDIASSAPKEIS